MPLSFVTQTDGANDGDFRCDPQQLRELCEEHYAAVSQRVHRMLACDLRRGRPWLASVLSTGDIVHEVFLGVVRDFDGFRGKSKQAFVAYLSRLVRNRLIDSVRHHEASRRDQRRNEYDVVDVNSSLATGGTEMARREEAALLHGILDRLPQRDRALLRGRLEDELPFQTLAESLGFATADSARKAFNAVQARVLALLQTARRGDA